MRRLAVPALMLATGAAVTTPASGGPDAIPGVANAVRARQNWMLACQGCHRADATGTPQTTPAMAGFVSKFLRVPGGREYLVQVPGVATAALSDADLAELMNWSLVRFDPGNVPADFAPYTTAEVRRLRLKPLRTEALVVRANLIAGFAPAKERQNNDRGGIR